MNATTRPIKVLVAKPGLDGHDVGAKVLCRFLMEAGMDVTYTGLRKSPTEIAQAAVAAEAEVIALSVLSGAHTTLCGKVLAELARVGKTDALVVAGGNIPPQDVDELTKLGVAKVFTTGSQADEVIAYLQGAVR